MYVSLTRFHWHSVLSFVKAHVRHRQDPGWCLRLMHLVHTFIMATCDDLSVCQHDLGLDVEVQGFIFIRITVHNLDILHLRVRLVAAGW